MIVDAAIKYPDGTIRTNKRHWLIIKEAASLGIASTGKNCVQGYVTDNRKFLDREHAKIHAIQCKQIPMDFQGTLYSELLWSTEQVKQANLFE